MRRSRSPLFEKAVERRAWACPPASASTPCGCSLLGSPSSALTCPPLAHRALFRAQPSLAVSRLRRRLSRTATLTKRPSTLNSEISILTHLAPPAPSPAKLPANPSHRHISHDQVQHDKPRRRGNQNRRGDPADQMHQADDQHENVILRVAAMKAATSPPTRLPSACTKRASQNASPRTNASSPECSPCR